MRRVSSLRDCNTKQKRGIGLVNINARDNSSFSLRNVNASDGDMTVNERHYRQGIRKIIKNGVDKLCIISTNSK